MSPTQCDDMGQKPLEATGRAPRRVLARREASCSLRGAAPVGVCLTGWAVALALLLLTSYTAAAQITLAWDASTSMVDGYWLYYGTQSGTYTARSDMGTATTFTVSGLTSGETYYFAVTAYDRTDNIESAFSNAVST